jgi:vitamin K-dependent gamma-carboxylase
MAELTVRQKLVVGFIAAWIGIQILVPLRYLLYPGNVSWTEEGHRFAWMMKLRDKEAVARFTVRDPGTGRQWEVDPEGYLLRHQVSEMESRPDMILQFSHHLARRWAEYHGVQGAEVRARVCASLNGRSPQLLIDPERDLVKIERNLRHADWVVPLAQPFERPEPRTGRVDLRCADQATEQ